MKWGKGDVCRRKYKIFKCWKSVLSPFYFHYSHHLWKSKSYKSLSYRCQEVKNWFRRAMYIYIYTYICTYRGLFSSPHNMDQDQLVTSKSAQA